MKWRIWKRFYPTQKILIITTNFDQTKRGRNSLPLHRCIWRTSWTSVDHWKQWQAKASLLHYKVMYGAEVRYQKIEKLANAIILASRRLKPFFQSHPIIIRIDQLIHQVLPKTNSARRLMAWSIELFEYWLTYEPGKVIKA